MVVRRSVLASVASAALLAVLVAPSPASAVGDTTPPGAVTPRPAVLAGSSITFTLDLPSDPDRANLLVTRTPTGGAAVPFTVPLPPAPASTMTWTDTGLTLGTTYAYSFSADDTSGNPGAASSRSATALGTAVSFADPVSKTSTKRTFPIRLTAPGWTVPAGVTFDIDVLPYSAGGVWKPWLRGTTGSVHTFGAGSIASVPGENYRFRARAHDAFGNAMAEHPPSSGPAIVPFDQSIAKYSTTWTSAASTTAWLGSVERAGLAGATARITFKGSQFRVIGIKCPGCGVFSIWQGTIKLGTFDTRAAATVPRTVLATVRFATVDLRTVVIKVAGTPGRPAVKLDGFAVRH